MTMPDESRYPIGVVTRRTGLSPDVLRVWERRYSVVAPTRSAGGQRLYSVSDMEKLRLLRRVVEGGHRIAAVASLDREELSRLAAEIPDTADAALGSAHVVASGILDELIDAVEALDDRALESRLRRAVLTLGTERWVAAVVGPMLTMVGDRWHAGTLTPAHEHLASATTREVLAWVIRSFDATADAPIIAIATPAGELHELGAMMAGVVAAECGWRVQYLGPNLPASDLAGAAKRLKARAVAISLVFPADAPSTIEDVRALRTALPEATPLLAGGAGARLAADELERIGVIFVGDTRELRSELAAITPNA